MTEPAIFFNTKEVLESVNGNQRVMEMLRFMFLRASGDQTVTMNMAESEDEVLILQATQGDSDSPLVAQNARLERKIAALEAIIMSLEVQSLKKLEHRINQLEAQQ